MNGSPEAQNPVIPPVAEPVIDPAVDGVADPMSDPTQHRGWTVRTSGGSTRRFHELDPDPGSGHEIWIHRVDRPAVIFGSTQVPGRIGANLGMADGAVAGSRIEVCRRRSGGGLVVVRPGDVWIDAVVPRHSPLHDDDVGLAFHWFGQVWLEALRVLYPGPDTKNAGLRLAEPPPGRRAADRAFFCFADVGHGEVVDSDRKVVGISQRRTRTWTRLQSLLVIDWNPEEVEGLVTHALTAVEAGDHHRAALGAPPHQAAHVRAGFAPGSSTEALTPETVVRAVLDHLPVVTDDD